MFMSQFFYGVVEDRDDPLMLGRLRVRIFGIHSALKVASETEGSPTDGLLWCYPMQSINSAAISGVGQSPTGAVEGTHVVGFFRDQMCQDGVLIGTIGGYPVKEANPNEGFNDPYGQYPRYINAPDTNVLARGGVTPSLPNSSEPQTSTQEPASVENQNLNTSEAIEPDQTPAEDIKEDDNPDYTIEKMLRFDEGVRVTVYWDHLGYPTVGIGHLIIYEATKNTQKINSELSKQLGRTVTDGRITDAECSNLFAKDVAKVKSDIQKNAKVGAVYATLDASRKMAIENMCFQMGVGGVAKFTSTLAYMALKQWDKAYKSMLDSVWAKQTPQRANRVSKIILNGNLSSYGVRPSNARANSSNVMFEEPKSAYAAKYPFNQVYQSESGHIEQFDDTPGAERYQRSHPVGTFEEIHPNGTRVVKIVGEDYLITKSNRNVHVQGDMNVVVDGNCKVYIMGNSDITVDGNVTQLIRGDVTEQIDGNLTQTVNGNVISLVKGNTEQTVNGNVAQHVDGNVDQTVAQNLTSGVTGNYEMTVDGNYSLTVAGSKTDKVSGDWNREAANVSDKASGSYVADGSGAKVELQGAAKITGSTVSIN